MANKIRRNIFSVSSKYQWQILALSLVPIVLGYFLLAGFLHHFNNQIGDHLVRGIPLDDIIVQIPRQVVMIDLFLVGLCFIFSMLVLAVSQDVVGPFDRINRELDDIIAGRSKRTIVVRPRDKLAQELLKRVNVLIESYVAKKKS